MKNRNLEHKNDWKTPQYLLSKLKEEFGELFDPCPFMHDISSWDGLKIEWGGGELYQSSLFSQRKRGICEKGNRREQKMKNLYYVIAGVYKYETFSGLHFTKQKRDTIFERACQIFMMEYPGRVCRE